MPARSPAIASTHPQLWKLTIFPTRSTGSNMNRYSGRRNSRTIDGESIRARCDPRSSLKLIPSTPRSRYRSKTRAGIAGDGVEELVRGVGMRHERREESLEARQRPRAFEQQVREAAVDDVLGTVHGGQGVPQPLREGEAIGVGNPVPLEAVEVRQRVVPGERHRVRDPDFPAHAPGIGPVRLAEVPLELERPSHGFAPQRHVVGRREPDRGEVVFPGAHRAHSGRHHSTGRAHVSQRAARRSVRGGPPAGVYSAPAASREEWSRGSSSTRSSARARAAWRSTWWGGSKTARPSRWSSGEPGRTSRCARPTSPRCGR